MGKQKHVIFFATDDEAEKFMTLINPKYAKAHVGPGFETENEKYGASIHIWTDAKEQWDKIENDYLDFMSFGHVGMILSL